MNTFRALGTWVLGAAVALTACATSPDPAPPGAVTETKVPGQGGNGKPAGPDAPKHSTEPPSTNNQVSLGAPAHSGPFDFGKIAIGEERTRSYTVFLTTDDPETTVGAGISGSSAFTVRETGCAAASQSSAAAGAQWHRRCGVEVRFAPGRPGSKTAELTVSAGAASDSATLTGTGTGHWPPFDHPPVPTDQPVAKLPPPTPNPS